MQNLMPGARVRLPPWREVLVVMEVSPDGRVTARRAGGGLIDAPAKQFRPARPQKPKVPRPHGLGGPIT